MDAHAKIVEQVVAACANVRKAKESTPWIFPEYQRLKHAEYALVLAQRDLEKTKQDWDSLGVSAAYPPCAGGLRVDLVGGL